jgi:hypothetical protein
MLNQTDQRLGKLESFIIPIHQATQKLTKIEERRLLLVISLNSVSSLERIGINQGKGQVDVILSLYAVLDAERPIISPG